MRYKIAKTKKLVKKKTKFRALELGFRLGFFVPISGYPTVYPIIRIMDMISSYIEGCNLKQKCIIVIKKLLFIFRGAERPI